MALISYLQLERFPISLLLPCFAAGASYLIDKEGRCEAEILIPLSAAILGTAGMCALNDCLMSMLTGCAHYADPCHRPDQPAHRIRICDCLDNTRDNGREPFSP